MSTTITISGKVYTVYSYTADAVADSDTYAASRPGSTWPAVGVSVAQKQAALVEATRWLESLRWLGSKTNPAQTLQWPRTGVSDANNVTIDPAVTPDQVMWAYFELANALNDDPTILSNQLGAASNVKMVKAGSAEVRYFRPVRGSRLPTQVWQWISLWASGASSSAAGLASGVDGVSSFDGTQDANVWDIVRK